MMKGYKHILMYPKITPRRSVRYDKGDKYEIEEIKELKDINFNDMILI